MDSGDKISISGSRIADNYGNFADGNGVSCSAQKVVVPLGNTGSLPQVLEAVRILAQPHSANGQPSGISQDRADVSLGDLASPLKRFCEEYDSQRNR